MALPFGDDHLWTACERVKENEGCAGCDGVTVRHFAGSAHKRIPELRERVNAGVYRPLPLLKIIIEKHAKHRPVATLGARLGLGRVTCPSFASRSSARFSDHAPYTKGNFQFERTVTGWRARYPALNLRLKK